MRFLATFLAVSAVQFVPSVLANTPNCKCSPGDSCWPSDDDWAGLNTTVNGCLIQSRPPASVCYETEPGFDRNACDEILDKWHQSTYHSGDPISITYPIWADNPCPPIFANGTSINGDPDAGDKGCTLGKYPSYVVNATGAEDIAAAVQWAAERNIRLNIKSTGHSHVGRSTAYGSLSIWTHNIRGIEFHGDFRSESCPAGNSSSTGQMAATIAAGETDEDVFKALDEHSVVVVGGASPSVGIMGWFTGGGHGHLSSTYGMGSDNVLEATVVLTNGTVVTTNACNYPDLFYAIRGGGGGTYGIVTSVVMKAYASPKTTYWSLLVQLQDPSKETEWWKLMAEFSRELKGYKDGGMQGYYYFVGPSSDPMLPVPYLGMGAFFNLYNKPEGTVDELFENFRRRLDGLNGTVQYLSDENTFDSFLEFYSTSVVNEAVGSNLVMGSWLLPAEAFEDVEAVAKAFQEVGPTSDPQKTPDNMIIGHFIANSDNRELETALNPAWRDAVSHLAVGGGLADWAPEEEIQAVRDDVTHRRVPALKKLAPNSGAYFNEMDAFEPDWQRASFGENYPRLRKIKDAYDPKGTLWCRGCVGSESWVEDEEGRLCQAEAEL